MSPPRSPRALEAGRRPLLAAAGGHLWTVAELLRRLLRPAEAPPSIRFLATVDDPVTGSQPVSGRLSRPPGARGLVLLVHGLGGSPDSSYMAALAAAAFDLGWASLRLALRGADGAGSDLYHAGLTADLHAALAAESVAGFDRVVVLGLSLGGHVALRFATEPGDRRLRAAAAVSAPLDLAAGAKAIDRPVMAPYRAYLLRGLRAHGERAWRAGLVAADPGEQRRVRTLRQWDALTVAPRFGFAGAADYYARASVGPRLSALRCPALLLAASADPMVPPAAIEPSLAGAAVPSALRVWRSRRGGHLAFPPTSAANAEPGGFGDQVLAWLVAIAVGWREA